jgi:hypothetical protein
VQPLQFQVCHTTCQITVFVEKFDSSVKVTDSFFSVRSFKTKGNLTKHMKSKAHTKNYAASGSGSSTQQSGTQSSESDTEDSGMDSSGESSCVDVALISGSLARKLSLILTTINVNNGVIKPAGHRNSLRR